MAEELKIIDQLLIDTNMVGFTNLEDTLYRLIQAINYSCRDGIYVWPDQSFSTKVDVNLGELIEELLSSYSVDLYQKSDPTEFYHGLSCLKFQVFQKLFPVHQLLNNEINFELTIRDNVVFVSMEVYFDR